MTSPLTIALLLVLLPSLIPAAPVRDIDIEAAVKELGGLSRNTHEYLNYVYFYTIIATVLGLIVISIVIGFIFAVLCGILGCCKSIYSAIKN